jgi:hypothetical protein
VCNPHFFEYNWFPHPQYTLYLIHITRVGPPTDVTSAEEDKAGLEFKLEIDLDDIGDIEMIEFSVKGTIARDVAVPDFCVTVFFCDLSLSHQPISERCAFTSPNSTSPTF